MKIIRWLLSHTFLILLIVVVIYGYMFWGNLLGKDTPAGKAVAYLSEEFVEVEEFVDAVKAKQAQLSENKSAQAKVDDEVNNQTVSHAGVQHSDAEMIDDPVSGNESADMAINEPVSKAINKPINKTVESGTDIEQQPVSISYSHNNRQVSQDSSGSIATTADKPADLDDDSFVSADVEQQLNNVDDNGQVIDPSNPGGEVKANWITARKSFYRRNYRLSEQSYQQVIESTVDNFDAYGELGNVYFNQGKKQQAASAYFEAASILIRVGQVSRARSLAGLLRQLDESKANELQKMLKSSS